MKSLPKIARSGLGILAMAALLVVASRSTTRASSAEPKLTLDGAVAWINTDGPVHLDRLRGKIVVLDFWTYCCINCHHILPDLARLEQKYKNQVVVIGVHTAKFDAERDTENIRSKVREYGIKHPVANDANQVIWDRFSSLSPTGRMGWPTIVVFDAEGEVAKVDAKGSRLFSGENHMGELDTLIGTLIAKAKARGELDEIPVEFPSESDKSYDGGLLYPGKITADAASKRLYISDTGHNRVVVTDLDGQFVEAVGNGKVGLVDGDFSKASFNRPQGTCLFEGLLYVADTENHAIRAVDFKAKTVKTVAGTGVQSHAYSGSGPGLSTPISSPWDVIPLPGTKFLAIAMAGPHQIWRFDTTKGVVSHWAGSGDENIKDGTLAQARFAQPSGLATDGQHLFVADSEVSGLRSITLGAQHRVGTIVGSGLFQFGDVDGSGEVVRLQHDLGLAYGDGKLYVADTYNNKIKVCDPKTRAVKTLVGSVKRGVTDDPAAFNEPGGLALLGTTLYVADTNNHLIRAVDLTSKTVRTLDLAGVRPPARLKVPKFANATLFQVPPVVTLPGKEVAFDINLVLPPGYKLSTEAPLIYLAESSQSGVFTDAVSPTGQEVEQPKGEFLVKLPLNKQAPTGSKLNVKLSLSAFICLPNSLCTVKNFVWDVPITFEPGSPDAIKLRTSP